MPSSPRHPELLLTTTCWPPHTLATAKTIPDKLLTLEPHRDSHVTYDIHGLLMTYLTNNDNASVDFIAYQWRWPGTPTRTELRDQATQWSNRQVEIADTPNNGHPPILDNNASPKQVMWERVLTDYTPSNHPSHIACAPPDCHGWSPQH
jgi:hypothetical protein